MGPAMKHKRQKFYDRKSFFMRGPIARRAERRDRVLAFPLVTSQENDAMSGGEDFAGRLKADAAVAAGNDNRVHDFLRSGWAAAGRITSLPCARPLRLMSRASRHSSRAKVRAIGTVKRPSAASCAKSPSTS